MLRVTLSGLFVFLLSSCAAGSAARQPSNFPKREALDRIAQAPLPEEILTKAEDVALWELEGPFPTEFSSTPHRYEDPWGRELEAMLPGLPGEVVATGDMACVARELGRFRLTRDGAPDPALSTFVKEHCGSLVSAVSTSWIEDRADVQATDAAIFEAWSKSYRKLLTSRLKGGNQSVGVWFGREKDRALVILAFGERKLRVEPMSRVPAAGGEIVLRGELLGPVEEITGLFNRGSYGFSRCEADSDVALPRFSLRCQLAPDDASARLMILSREPGRFLSNGIGSLEFFPMGAPSGIYRRSSLFLSAAPVTTSPREEFFSVVNLVRREASLSPVVLAMGQSDLAERVAPHYFATATKRETGSDADQIALGMMAGWEVNGLVRGAGFSSGSVQTESIPTLVANLVDSPLGRSALLGPDIDQIAIGLVRSGDGAGLGAVIGSYTTFDEVEHDALIDQVLDVLGKERVARGLTYPYWLDELKDPSLLAVNWIESGSDEPQRALKKLLNRSSHLLQGAAYGWVLETDSLENLKFPEKLLEVKRFGIIVGVARFKPEGEPWGRYAVLLVASSREL